MLLGVHVSGAAKIYDAFEIAAGLGCNTMQIFGRNPQRWRERFLIENEVAEFKAKRKKFKISPVFIHIPYLLNLASPDEKLFDDSVKAYIEDMQEASNLGAEYIVTHMGSHKDTSEAEGLERLALALNLILEAAKELDVDILLENTSGSGSWLGYRFWHQKKVIEDLKRRERVGLCIDTAHAFAAGFDIATKEGLEATLAEIDTLIGLDKIKLIHLNDTKKSWAPALTGMSILAKEISAWPACGG